jgi:hypothetical protein
VPVLTRRTLLAVALVGVLGARQDTAAAAQVRAGALVFDVPPGVLQTEASPWGRQWQYSGVAGDPLRPSIAVAARGDLALASAREGLALVLAAPAAGALPRFRLTDVVERRVDGAATAVSGTVRYVASNGARLTGALLSAAAADDGAGGVLLVVGDEALTAAVTRTFLASVRLVGAR